jgi:hypothetical protein
MRNTIAVGLMVSGMLAASVLPAAAGATPQQKCGAAKQKAAGKDVSGELACYSKAIGKGGIAVDPTCLGKSTGKFDAAFSKAGTACVGDDPAIQGNVNSCINQLVLAITSLDPSSTFPVLPILSKCEAAKVKAAGGKAAAKLNCTAKSAGSGKPLDPTCIAKAETKFSTAIGKADAKGMCPGTVAGIESIVDSTCFNAIASQLPPVAPGCGNGLIEPALGETCDDGATNGVPPDTCPASCAVAQCTPGTTPVTFTVSYAGSNNVGGITVLVDYPEGKVNLPGSGGDPNVVASITNLPGGTLPVSNDLDWGLVQIVTSLGAALPPGNLFTMNFKTCTGAPAATPADFTCKVTDASDPTGTIDLTSTVTCSVSTP